jgi:hypothetical protein
MSRRRGESHVGFLQTYEQARISENQILCFNGASSTILEILTGFQQWAQWREVPEGHLPDCSQRGTAPRGLPGRRLIRSLAGLRTGQKAGFSPR